MPEDVACPFCAQQPHEACVGTVFMEPDDRGWLDYFNMSTVSKTAMIKRWPSMFHAERMEAALFIAGVEAGVDESVDALTDDETKGAIDRAAAGYV